MESQLIASSKHILYPHLSLYAVESQELFPAYVMHIYLTPSGQAPISYARDIAYITLHNHFAILPTLKLLAPEMLLLKKQDTLSLSSRPVPTPRTS